MKRDVRKCRCGIGRWPRARCQRAGVVRSWVSWPAPLKCRSQPTRGISSAPGNRQQAFDGRIAHRRRPRIFPAPVLRGQCRSDPQISSNECRPLGRRIQFVEGKLARLVCLSKRRSRRNFDLLGGRSVHKERSHTASGSVGGTSAKSSAADMPTHGIRKIIAFTAFAVGFSSEVARRRAGSRNGGRCFPDAHEGWFLKVLGTRNRGFGSDYFRLERPALPRPAPLPVRSSNFRAALGR